MTHAINLYLKNGNRLWYQVEQAEVKKIFDYDKSTKMIHNVAWGIKVCFVCAVKHNGRRKVCLVAGGHFTAVPDESVCSGVVSLKGICIVIFLGRLNNLPMYCADIGSAYLEAKIREKVNIIAGP